MSTVPASRTGSVPVASSPGATTWPHQLDHAPTLRVGDVMAALGNEFASLSPSKLRFLDAQGLVSPCRTPAGYRLYSAADVERLRYVLRQQRDAYAPLTVIKARLDQLDAGVAHEPIGLSVVASADLGIDELANACATRPEIIRELIENGVLHESAPGLLDRECVPLAVACASYLAAGADMRQVRALVRGAQREAADAASLVRSRGSRDESGHGLAALDSRLSAAADLYRAAIMSAGTAV